MWVARPLVLGSLPVPLLVLLLLGWHGLLRHALLLVEEAEPFGWLKPDNSWVQKGIPFEIFSTHVEERTDETVGLWNSECVHCTVWVLECRVQRVGSHATSWFVVRW